MSQVEITVRGHHRAYAQPERATARLAVAIEGPRQAEVHEAIAEASRAVIESIRPLHDPDRGPVTWWSTGQLRTGARRPWNKDGKQLPLVHHAQIDVQAKFSDFAALSRWAAEVLPWKGVRLAGIEWALTERRRHELTAQVRRAAVADARDKAQSYADALGMGAVQAVAVADAGMLGQGMRPERPEAAMYSRALAMAAPDGGGSSEIELAPEDIEIDTSIDARFLVG